MSLPNGVVSGSSYNAVNRLEQLTHSVGANAQTLLAGYTYGLAANGQRVVAVDANGRTSSYGYDALGRLEQETISGDPGVPTSRNGQIGYVYDAVGNRLSRTSSVAGLVPQAFGYDANDRVQGDSFDQNGNTTAAPISQPANAFSALPQSATGNPQPVLGTDVYDSQDRLRERTGASGARVQVIYDGDRQKVREVVTRQGLSTVTSYLVDELNPTGYAQVVEEKTNGTLTRVYTYGLDLISQDQLIGSSASGTWKLSYYGYDGHGNVRFLTDESGAVTDRYDFDAFGTLLSVQGSTPNLYLYCGEAYDGALGLYYLRERLMNPLTGRFWTADSYEGQNSDPASLHKYLYTNADPVNGSDPSGYMTLMDIDVTLSIVLAVTETQATFGYWNYRRALYGSGPTQEEQIEFLRSVGGLGPEFVGDESLMAGVNPGLIRTLISKYTSGGTGPRAGFIHDVYTKFVSGLKSRAFGVTGKGKLGSRIYDHFDPVSRSAFESNTTPWASNSPEKLSHKLEQLASDQLLLERGAVSRVVWFGTEPLPRTGRARALLDAIEELQNAGYEIVYWVVPI